MREYPKINSVFKRDDRGRMLLGEWARREFEYLRDNQWQFTEKVDGTNIRIIFTALQEIRFEGKTDRAQIPAFLVNRLNERFRSEAMTETLKTKFDGSSGVCLYGEGYGARIQKGGGNYRADVDFVLFDVWVDGWWLERANVEDVAVALGLDVVPVAGEGTLDSAIELCRQGFKSAWGDFLAEGLVMKPMVELFDRRGGRIITKVKHKDFERALEEGK